MTNERKFGLSM